MTRIHEPLIAFFITSWLLISCNPAPKPIKLGTDSCNFCKMSIADEHFGAEMISKQGKVYKFDDIHCLIEFIKVNDISKGDIRQTWLINYEQPHNFIPAEKAFLVKSNKLHSPMGGNVASFDDEKKMNDLMKNIKGEKISIDSILNKKNK